MWRRAILSVSAQLQGPPSVRSAHGEGSGRGAGAGEGEGRRSSGDACMQQQLPQQQEAGGKRWEGGDPMHPLRALSAVAAAEWHRLDGRPAGLRQLSSGGGSSRLSSLDEGPAACAAAHGEGLGSSRFGRGVLGDGFDEGSGRSAARELLPREEFGEEGSPFAGAHGEDEEDPFADFDLPPDFAALQSANTSPEKFSVLPA
jgi:hypothetical protein